MVGDEVVAQEFSRTLFSHGVYAVSFSYPVVPRGMARIRTQMSAAHSTSDLDFAIAQFIAARPSTIPEANAE
jgi:glycine C-acetyltransferase